MGPTSHELDEVPVGSLTETNACPTATPTGTAKRLTLSCGTLAVYWNGPWPCRDAFHIENVTRTGGLARTTGEGMDMSEGSISPRRRVRSEESPLGASRRGVPQSVSLRRRCASRQDLAERAGRTSDARSPADSAAVPGNPLCLCVVITNVIHEDDAAPARLGRPWWLGPALVAVTVGAVVGAIIPDRLTDRPALRTGDLRSSRDTFAPASYDVRVPADISWIVGANCGFSTDQNPAARLEPPRQTATGLWTFDGCIVSAGSVLYDVTLSLSFPSGEHLAIAAVEETSRYGETRFKVEVNRASIGGASPTFYANYARRP